MEHSRLMVMGTGPNPIPCGKGQRDPGQDYDGWEEGQGSRKPHMGTPWG